MGSSDAASPFRSVAYLLIAIASVPAHAQNAADTAPVADVSILHEPRVFVIEALPLEAAVLRFSDQAGVQLLMSPLTDTKLQSSPINGRMPIDQALDMLLAGTPLHWRALGSHTVTIERISALDPDAQHVLDPIRVEGIRKKQRARFQVADWDDRVVAILDRYKRYPSEAQRLGLQDIVYVRITVDRSGRILNSMIARSRGVGVLDTAALDLVSRVIRLPRLPDDIEGSRYSVIVPIDYFMAPQ